MSDKPQFLTAIQEIAINCVFSVLGECRYNRTWQEYNDICSRLPPLKVLQGKVNDRFKALHEEARTSGHPLPLICRFKAGDQRSVDEPYPSKISYETLRKALIVFGFRTPRQRSTSQAIVIAIL